MTTMGALVLCGLNNTVVYFALNKNKKQKAVVLYSDLSTWPHSVI